MALTGLEVDGVAETWTRHRSARSPSTFFRRLAREPLVHFFAVGLVLFVAAERHRADADMRRIVVTPAEVGKLAESYRLQFGADPTPQTLAQLVDKYVDEEVLFREGMALKLDRDDQIVRRRVVQKMEFLEQDLAAPKEPSRADLEAYYRGHAAAYAAPSKVTFSQIFFAEGKGGSDRARQRAQAALSRLQPSVTRAPALGDDFPGLYDYADVEPEQAGRLFGDGGLSDALFLAPVGRWTGPYRSAYGWHLVRLADLEKSTTPPLDQVRDKVRSDLLASEQDQANARAFADLKARFTVVREDFGERP